MSYLVTGVLAPLDIGCGITDSSLKSRHLRHSAMKSEKQGNR